jgi:hypothetical protein
MHPTSTQTYADQTAEGGIHAKMLRTKAFIASPKNERMTCGTKENPCYKL